MKKYGAVSLGKASAIICLILIILMPDNATEGAKRGIWLCGEIIIPSTFAFMALAGFIMKISAFSKPKISSISRFISRIFNLPSCFLSAFIMGMLSGYPVGAKCVTQLKNDCRLSREQAERCLSFCVGAGPAFIITAVGKGILGSFTAGVIIFVSQLLSCAIFGIVSGLFNKREDLKQIGRQEIQQEANIADCLVTSVKDACTSMLNISSFVILFSVLLNIAVKIGIMDILSAFLTFFGIKRETAFILSGGFLEVTGGCAMCGSLSAQGMSAISGIIGFGGISVFFQIAAVTNKTGMRMSKFFLSRLIIALLSAVITAIGTNIFDLAQETVALSELSAGYSLHSLPVCTVLTVFSIALIISDKRKGEICGEFISKA